MTAAATEPSPPADARAERWERRLTPVVVGAAVAVLPLLALSLARPHGTLHELETIGHWVVWLLFFAEAAIMLSTCVAHLHRRVTRRRAPAEP